MTLRGKMLLISAATAVGLMYIAYLHFDSSNDDPFQLLAQSETYPGKSRAQQDLAQALVKARRPYLSSSPLLLKVDVSELEMRLKEVAERVRNGYSSERPRNQKLNALIESFRIIEQPNGRVRAITAPSGDLRALLFEVPITIGDVQPQIIEMIERHRLLFNFGESETLGVSRTTSLNSPEKQTLVFERHFKGVPVLGNDLSATIDDGLLRGIVGNFRQLDPSFETSSGLSANEVALIAAGESSLKAYEIDAGRKSKNILFLNNLPVLVESLTASDVLGRRVRVHIGVATRKVVQIDPLYYEAQRPTSAIDLKGEAVEFDVEEVGSSFYLKDLNALPEPAVLKMELDVSDFSTNALVESNSLAGPWDPAAVSAISNAQTALHYFYEIHNLEGLGGGDPLIHSIVNMSTIPYLDNAYWSSGTIGYGSGGEQFTNLAEALDVAAHEITHGVIEYSSNLRYQNQSGALNESFADYFGVMVEREDWWIGEDISKQGQFLRSLDSPSAKGQPEHMRDFKYLPLSQDQGGVHINSGIPNRAMYLLTEGLSNEGLGTSIGIQKSEQLIYQTLVSLTRDTDFVGAASSMLILTEAEYGESSLEANAVTEAWREVGIDLIDQGGSSDTPYVLSVGDDLLIHLYPRSGLFSFDLNDELLDLYSLKTTLTPGEPPSVNFAFSSLSGPLNDQLVKPVPISTATTDSGVTWIGYVGLDGVAYFAEVTQDFVENIPIDLGIPIEQVSLAPDFSKFAFVIEGWTSIFVFDFDTAQLDEFVVNGRDYSTDGLSELVTTVDSIGFSIDGDTIVFDYQVCRRSTVVGRECDYVWSIGILDPATGIDYPFPGQPSTIDVGFPKLSSVGDPRFVFDLHNYEDYPAVEPSAHTILYDWEKKTFEGVYSDPLFTSFEGFSDLSSFGRPDFYPGDLAVTYTSTTPLKRGMSLTTLSSNHEVAYELLAELAPYPTYLGKVHRAAHHNIFSSAYVSEPEVQLGLLMRGNIETEILTLENNGNQYYQVTSVDAPEGVQTNLGNVKVHPGEGSAFQLTLDSTNVDLGEYEELLNISTTADTGNTNITVKATIDTDSDGDGTRDLLDEDDDNDGTLDVNDAFPLDSSETKDTDSDGVGDNSDLDDDNDGLSDQLEVAEGLDPLSPNECPAWLCGRSGSRVWKTILSSERK